MSSVLAIHGVDNRHEAAFDATVTGLTALGAPPLRPVFWGNLGPAPPEPLSCIPTPADIASVPEPAAIALPSSEALAGPAADLATNTIAKVRDMTGQAEVPTETQDAIRAATSFAQIEGLSFAVQADLSASLATIVLTAPPEGTAQITVPGAGEAAFGLVDRVRDAMHTVLQDFDREATKLLVSAFRGGEAHLGATIAGTIGDILRYQSAGPAIRARLDAAFRKARTDQPVDIIAHSLGALIVVEWLLGASVDNSCGPPTQPGERRIRNLVTFGAQVSLFSMFEGLRGVNDAFGSTASPRDLSLPLEQWWNVWQELDPLAFVMFHTLHVNNAGAHTTTGDLSLTQQHVPTSLSFHSSYWTDPRFAHWLTQTLGT